MAENKFRSVFKDELNIYMEHRKSCGIKESGAISNLRKLDAFWLKTAQRRVLQGNMRTNGRKPWMASPPRDITEG